MVVDWGMDTCARGHEWDVSLRPNTAVSPLALVGWRSPAWDRLQLDAEKKVKTRAHTHRQAAANPMASSSRENASDLMLVYPSCHEGALKLCTYCDSR